MREYQISASIVVYKSDPEELSASVRSVINSPVRALCTVVDNSPTSDLRSVVLKNGAKYVFLGKNLGFGGGHNVALRNNRDLAEFHLIQNPDVRFSSEVLPKLYKFMSDNREIGLVMPRVLYPDGTEQHLCKQLPSPLDLIARRFLGKLGKTLFSRRLRQYELNHVDLGSIREVPNLSGCFMLISNSVIETAGLFDERFFMYMEDVDFCRRIGRDYKTIFYPCVSVYHGYAKGSYKKFYLLRYHTASAIRYFFKWGWWTDAERDRVNERIANLDVDRKEKVFSN